MSKSKDTLETKFLFRLIKVAYFIALLTGALFVVAVGGIWKESQYIDEGMSTLSCINGETFTLKDLGISSLSEEDQFTGYDEKEIIKACGSELNVEQIKYVKGSPWLFFGLVVLLGFIGVYITFNLIRETLHYILFGRDFSWDWILKWLR